MSLLVWHPLYICTLVSSLSVVSGYDNDETWLCFLHHTWLIRKSIKLCKYMRVTFIGYLSYLYHLKFPDWSYLHHHWNLLATIALNLCKQFKMLLIIQSLNISFFSSSKRHYLILSLSRRTRYDRFAMCFCWHLKSMMVTRVTFIVPPQCML